MIYLNKFKLSILLFIIFFIGFVNSEEIQTIENSTDIGNQIIAKGVELQRLSNENTKLTFVSQEAEVNVKGDLFTNITTQEGSGHPTFLEFDNEGNILKADFTVNEKGGNYVFGNTRIYVPPNSRVIFDGNEILVKPVKDSAIIETPKPKDPLFLTRNVIFNGENIKLPDGSTFNGKLSFEDGRAFIRSGDELILNDEIRFLPTQSNVNLYFRDDFDAVAHENENYYWQAPRGFAIHSTNLNDGKINTEFLSGNKFFEMNRREYLEDKGNLILFEEGDEKNGFLKDDNGFKYKLVLDERDFLRISAENGDQILALKEEAGKIPDLLHVSSKDGKTTINNGLREFVLAEDKIFYNLKYPKNQEEFDKIFSEDSAQSVGFQLKSPTMGEKVLRFSKFDNQFALLNPDQTDERVVINPYGRPVAQYPEEIRNYLDVLFDPTKEV